MMFRIPPIPPKAGLWFFLILVVLSQAYCSQSRLWRDQKNLLFITIDTLRADRLGCYGYESIETPNFDSLAEEGVLFESVRTPVPLTLPAHISIMTGLYPPATGVHNNLYDKLGDQAVTLAELLRDNGWKTAAILGSYVLHGKFGLAQGFDHYDDRFVTRDPGLAAGHPERSAEDVADLGIEWLQKNGSRGKFFLWLHFYDPHVPYLPPEPFASKYPGKPYDGEVAYTDYHFGRVLSELKRLGLYKDTVIVLVGDHGEGLQDHGEASHGLQLYDSTMKVPLIIRVPSSKKWPASMKVSHDTTLVDLMPTCLKIMAISNPAFGRDTDSGVIHGRDLGHFVDTDAERSPASGPGSRPLYFESRYGYDEYGWAPLAGFVVGTPEGGRFKYIRAPEPELYDMEADPGEMNNLADSRPQMAAKMDNQLRSLIKSLIPPGGALSVQTVISMEDLKQLHALGYVSSSPAAPISDEDAMNLPNPKDMLDIAQSIQRGQTLVIEGRYEEVMELLLKYIERDPKNSRLFLLLGQGSEALGHDDKAIDYFRKVISIKPKDPFALMSMAQLLMKREELDTAGEVIKLRKAYYPHDPVNIKMEGRLYAARGDWVEAARSYKIFLESEPQNADGHLLLGMALEETGEIDKAILAYKSAIHYSPRLAEARARLSVMLLKQNKPGQAIPHIKRWIELEPGDGLAYNALGRALLETSDGKGAVKNFLKALELNQEDCNSLLNMARIAQIHPGYDAREWWGRYVEAATRAGVSAGEIDEAGKLFEEAGGLH